jgi:hypothetical protein
MLKPQWDLHDLKHMEMVARFSAASLVVGLVDVAGTARSWRNLRVGSRA